MLKAAEQGDALAQYNLGLMYYHGHGVPQSYINAYLWVLLSAAQGDMFAQIMKDNFADPMTREQIEKAQSLAQICYAKDYKGCD